MAAIPTRPEHLEHLEHQLRLEKATVKLVKLQLEILKRLRDGFPIFEIRDLRKLAAALLMIADGSEDGKAGTT